MKKYVLLGIDYLIGQICQEKNFLDNKGHPAIMSVSQNQPCTGLVIIFM
jgi:hypothetical protein